MVDVGDGSIGGASVGPIEGTGEGAIGVTVGARVGGRVASGVNSRDTFLTGSLGVGTISGWGNSKLLTACRTGAGKRAITRDCSRGGSTFNTIKLPAHSISA